MFGLPPSTFYHPSFMYLPSQDLTKVNAADGKRKQFGKCQPIAKKLSTNTPERPVKKCAFDIESLLEIKTKDNHVSNRSYNEDTEDGSSDDGHTNSYRSPPISSYALFNQLKTLEMTSNNNKTDLTLSSSSDSDQSPYRLTSANKHLASARHSINHKIKPKRIRTIFTPEQLERLESEFDKQQYMVGNERFYLATTLDLSEAQVKVWFQNRRIKWRRQTLDDHQQRLTSLTGHNMQTSTKINEENQDSDIDE